MSNTQIIGNNFDYVISGADFNKEHDKIQFYKFLPNDLMFYNYQYELGLNSNELSFDSTGSYIKGGLYFCDKSKCHLFWKSYGTKLALITIPNDATVYVEKDKFKSNKIIITDILDFTDVPDDFWLIIFNHSCIAFEYIKNQTEELCVLAINKNPWLIASVHDQFLTEELCKLAVNISGIVLQLIKNQTKDICTLAVKQHGMALKYVQNQFLTKDICFLAVKQDIRSLQYVNTSPVLTAEIIDDVSKYAVSEDGYALQYVDKQTEEICILAVNQNTNAAQYVNPEFVASLLPKKLH